MEKRRALRRYRLDGQQVVALAPAEASDQGCDLELTRIAAGREAWWSVGLEAYGAVGELERCLLLVTKALTTGIEGFSLAAADSYGYPHWLLRIGATGVATPNGDG